jgi:hypothetical protein
MEKTLSQILAENLAYYVNDTSKRCYVSLSEEITCKYSGTTLRLDTDGCFVGRFLTPEDRIKADEANVGDVRELIQLSGIDTPRIIIDNEELFLEFQVLHDGLRFWGENCLNGTGKGKLIKLIEDFSLDRNEFEKFL